MKKTNLLAAGLAAMFCFSPVAFAAETPWIDAEHSRLRLISANPVLHDGRARIAAGLEIELQQGWKTYWRTPGDGLAPMIDWEGSSNVKDVDVLWPAPERFEMPGNVISYGYERSLTVPFLLVPRDAGEPMTLALRFSYGVCADICIPAEAVVELSIPAADDGKHAAALLTSLKSVPQRQDQNTDCAHRFISGERITNGGKPALLLKTASAAGADRLDLFVERADGLFMPPAMPLMQDTAGRHHYVVTFDFPGDAEDLAGQTLDLTMTSAMGNCETSWRME